MTSERKSDLLDRWLPMIVAVIGGVIVNAVIVGIAYGHIEEKSTAEAQMRADKDSAIASAIMPMDKQVEYFVTRKEWELRNATRDAEMHTDKEAWLRETQDIKKELEEQDRKLDLLLTRRQ